MRSTAHKPGSEQRFVGKLKRHKGGMTLGVLALAMVLTGCLLPSLPRAKVRSTRISSVNHVACASIDLPVTHALSNQLDQHH